MNQRSFQGGRPPRRPAARSTGPTLSERLDEVFEARETPFFLAVDELHHGQNLATLLQVADAGGVHGIVLPPARSHPGPNPAVRALAGAACDRIPLHREGLQSALSTLRRAGVLVVGAAEDGTESFDEVDYTLATVFVLGGEDKGLSPAVRKKCDALVKLPMVGRVPSLNVAATASVLVFERLRQLREAAREAEREAARPVPERVPYEVQTFDDDEFDDEEFDGPLDDELEEPLDQGLGDPSDDVLAEEIPADPQEFPEDPEALS